MKPLALVLALVGCSTPPATLVASDTLSPTQWCATYCAPEDGGPGCAGRGSSTSGVTRACSAMCVPDGAMCISGTPRTPCDSLCYPDVCQAGMVCIAYDSADLTFCESCVPSCPEPLTVDCSTGGRPPLCRDATGALVHPAMNCAAR